jgi:plasmid stability protein
MGVTLSIENVPEEIVARLKRRAEQNRRSLQGELREIVESAAGSDGRLSPMQAYAEAQRVGLKGLGPSVDMIRADRDAR